jgi:hypothetical protein
VFPCQFHSTGAPLKWKSRENIIITGLQNKPSRLVASVASAAGPFNKNKSRGSLLICHKNKMSAYDVKKASLYLCDSPHSSVTSVKPFCPALYPRSSTPDPACIWNCIVNQTLCSSISKSNAINQNTVFFRKSGYLPESLFLYSWNR